MKSHPVNASGRKKIARAIANGWEPGLPPSWFYKRKKCRVSRPEAGRREI